MYSNIFKINFLLFIILLTLISFSCKNSKSVSLDHYEIIPQDSLMTWLQESRFPKPIGVIYLDSVNLELPQDSIFRILNLSDIKLSYYWNIDKEIKYIKLTDASKSDKEFFKKMNAIENANFSGINDVVNIVKVDCNKKGEILNSVFDKDQLNRKDGYQGINKLIDQQNLELVYSLHSKCGASLFNDLDEKQLLSIWLVIQHSSPHFRKEFYPIFESLTDQNIMDKEVLVMMEDRILMDQNLPQKYGTQVRDDKLYKIDNIDSVNVRRERIGLSQLDVYLKELNVK